MPSRTLQAEMPYATLSQQGETAQLGMWVFIATETLFFGALLFTYFVYRNAYPEEFADAGKDTVLWCGTVNLALLLTSSLTMVLSITAMAEGRRDGVVLWLLATALLGFVFLCVKAYEYHADYQDQVVPAVNFMLKPGMAPASELFWVFYFIAHWTPCGSPVDWHRPDPLHAVARAPPRSDPCLLCAAGGGRTVLELCRYGMDLSFSGDLSRGPLMKIAAKQSPLLLYVVAWLILLLLTGLSLISAFLRLGVFGPIAQFGIAATQAAIIFILFMRLKGPPTLNWLFAGAGFYWLLFLYGLSMTDYATRRGWP